MNPVLDLLGRTIKAGDVVVYPCRQGANMWLSRLTVTQVTPGDRPRLSGYNTEGRRVALNAANKAGQVVVVIVTPPAVAS